MIERSSVGSSSVALIERDGFENNYLVGSGMLIENGLLSEILTALTALIRFFAGVDTYMLSDAKTKKNVKYVDAKFGRFQNLPDSKWFAAWRSADSKCNRTVFHWCVFVNAVWDAIVVGNVCRIRGTGMAWIQYECNRAAEAYSFV